MKIISWYTKNTPYKAVCEKYFMTSNFKNLDYKVYEMDSLSNWRMNTNLKPLVIERALNETDESILVVDADAIIHQYPAIHTALDYDRCDIAYHLMDRDWFFGKEFGKDRFELLSGTLYFKNNQKSREIVKAWKESPLQKKWPDQKVLQVVLKDLSGVWETYLPASYCWINSLPNGKPPFRPRPEPVVIEHFQASREYKDKLDTRL